MKRVREKKRETERVREGKWVMERVREKKRETERVRKNKKNVLEELLHLQSLHSFQHLTKSLEQLCFKSL